MGGAAAGDIGSLAAQLDDPLTKEIIGSMQAQLEIESHDNAEMQGQIAALQADNGAKQTQIESLLAHVEQHTMQIDNCLDAWSAFDQFSNKTDVGTLKADVQPI